MKLETRKGLFVPRNRRIEDVKDDGSIIVLYSPESGEAEWVRNNPLAMEVAEKTVEISHLELMILSWD